MLLDILRGSEVNVSLLHLIHMNNRLLHEMIYIGRAGQNINRIQGFKVYNHGSLVNPTYERGRDTFSVAEALFRVFIAEGKLTYVCMFLDYITDIRYKAMIRIGIIDALHLSRHTKEYITIYEHLLRLAPEHALDSVLSVVNDNLHWHCDVPYLTPRQLVSVLYCAVKRGNCQVVSSILTSFDVDGEYKDLLVKAFFKSITHFHTNVFDEFIKQGIDIHYPHRGTAYRVARDSALQDVTIADGYAGMYMQDTLEDM